MQGCLLCQDRPHAETNKQLDPPKFVPEVMTERSPQVTRRPTLRDTEAIRILQQGYWWAGRWKYPSFSDSQLEFLAKAGYAVHNKRLSHEECLQWALSVRDLVTPRRVANAFVYSLTTRHLEYRSALGSYANLQHMPMHKFQRTDGFHTDFCRHCGYEGPLGRQFDTGTLHFERVKWGGVRHNHLFYMALDIECFAKLEAVEPTLEDYQVLADVLNVVARSRTVGEIKKSLARVIKSNDSERAMLCEILAYAGVIRPHGIPSLAHSFIPWENRGDAKPHSDQQFPLNHWSGNGFCKEAVKYWFPAILIQEASPTNPAEDTAFVLQLT